MEVEVQVMAENPITGECTHTNTAYLVYVALDENGQPARPNPNLSAAIRVGNRLYLSGMLGNTPDNNPSPGNKAGGLTTIYEKALGAIAKGGSTPLTLLVNKPAPMIQSAAAAGWVSEDCFTSEPNTSDMDSFNAPGCWEYTSLASNWVTPWVNS